MNDLTPEQARLRVNLPRTSFWRWVWKGVAAEVLVVIKHGRTYRIDAASFEAWRGRFKVTCAADLVRLTDGRRAA